MATCASAFGGALARSLGLKVYGIVEKTGRARSRIPGLSQALASLYEPAKQGSKLSPIILGDLCRQTGIVEGM